MRYLFKKSYDDDIRLFKHRGMTAWYGALAVALLAAPLVLPPYALEQLTFVFIYAVVGAGLVLLIGYAGQVSLGHAAFVGIGAYAQAGIVSLGASPLLGIVCAGALAALAGIAVGLPVLRLKGIYLAIATLAFGEISEEVFVRWESVTRGNLGFPVPAFVPFGLPLGDGAGFAYVCLAILTAALLLVLNILRSPSGRALKAIRDSEISARSVGVNVARMKTAAFAISAGLAGVGGALYAHKIGYISPDQFGLMLSIELVMMVVVGGLGSMHGAVLGAVFIVALPQAIAVLKDHLPAAIGQPAGLQPLLFGLVLVAFVQFEPAGLHGRWAKIRFALEHFPIYRRNIFRRQRKYIKTERLT